MRPYQSPIPVTPAPSLRQSIKARLFVAVVVAAVAGVIWFQHLYIQHHVPLIRAGLAAAEQDGAGRLEMIGVPTGATAQGAVKKNAVPRR